MNVSKIVNEDHSSFPPTPHFFSSMPECVYIYHLYLCIYQIEKNKWIKKYIIDRINKLFH